MSDDELQLMSEQRGRRIRITAWIVIVSLIIGGGGATLLALLFG